MPKPNLSSLDSLKNLTESFSNISDTQLTQLESELVDNHSHLEDTVLNLSDYLKTIEMVIKETFNHQVWVKAEIRNLSSKSGHYYFELAEKDDQGKIIASCRGNLWRYQAERVLNKFSRYTGMQLTRDLTVMLKVSANLHPQYGFSLTISDIDPNYTLGDLARQYAAMLERLTGEGLVHLNKRHPLPLDIKDVIVIAPEKAAGLGDFRAEADRLERHNACHFHYHHSTFQGNHAPAEMRQVIIKAVSKFEKAHHRLPDLMVIIRGGGAVGDLAYLNDYELAALVAEQNIPVWVGIGHEKDRVMLDEVAHTSFDTPSKVVMAIINHLRHLVDNVQSYRHTIEKQSRQKLQLANAQSDKLISNIQAYGISKLIQVQKDCEYNMNTVELHAKRHLRQSQQASNQYLYSIQKLANHELKVASKYIDTYQQTVKKQAQQQIDQAKKDTQHLRELILLQHPNNIINQGYSLLKNKHGQILTSVSQIHNNQSVKIILKDGQALATIDDTTVAIEEAND